MAAKGGKKGPRGPTTPSTAPAKTVSSASIHPLAVLTDQLTLLKSPTPNKSINVLLDKLHSLWSATERKWYSPAGGEEKGSATFGTDYRAITAFILLLQSSDASTRLAALKAIRAVSSLQICNDMLKHDGHLIRILQQMLTDTDFNIVREASSVVDCLKKATPNTWRIVPFGVSSDGVAAAYTYHLLQTSYELHEAAWRVWDGGILFGRWCHHNSDLFAGRNVLEVGSGCCGVTGMVVAAHAREVMLSDYTADIVRSLKFNVDINRSRLPSNARLNVGVIDVTSDTLPASPAWLRGRTDIMICAEVFYTLELGTQMAAFADRVLGSQGVLYGMCSIKRLGVANFINEMTRRNWIVEDTFPGTAIPSPDELTLDLDTTQRMFYCRRASSATTTAPTTLPLPASLPSAAASTPATSGTVSQDAAASPSPPTNSTDTSEAKST